MDRNLKIQVLLQATDRFTRPMRDLAAGGTKAAQSLKETRDRLAGLEKAQASIGSFRSLRAGLQSTTTDLAAARTRVGELRAAVEATDAPTRTMTRELARAENAASRLAVQQRRQAAELRTTRTAMRDAGVGVRDLAGHEDRLGREIGETTRRMEEQSRRVTQLADRQRRAGAARASFGRVQGMAGNMAASGVAAIGTGMTIGAGVWQGVKAAQEYESVMTDIAQKADLPRAKAVEIGKALLVASKAANQLPDALQAGVDTLAGFGLSPEKAVAMMTPIGRAATAYKAEIADLSAAAFAANDNLKVPVEQTARVIDIMAAAGKAGAFEVKDMAGAFPSLTAGYQALGQKGAGAVADLAAALQIARKGAGDSSTAANNVANIIQKISSPATIKAFSKFGIDLPAALKKAYAEGKTPLEAIAELTKKATGGDLGKMGFLFEDAQVQQGLRPLIQNLDEYRKIRADALGGKGVTDTDFAQRLNDSAEQTKQLKINAMALAIGLGGALLPTVNAITAKLAGYANALSGIAQRHPVLTKYVGLAAAGLAALFLVLGGGAIAIAAVLGPFALLSAVATYTGIAMLPLIGTVAAVVLGIAALALAAYAIYANWGHMGAWFGGVWQSIKDAGSSTLSWFASLPGRFVDFGRNLVSGLIRGVVGMLGALKSTIVGAAGAAAGWFKQKLGIRSPSRVFLSFGGYMMEGLGAGIDGGSRDVVTRVGGVATRLAATMAGASLAAPSLAQPPRLVQQIETRAQEVRSAIGTGERGRGEMRRAADRSPSAAIAPIAAVPPVYNITINQAPGQSADDLARAIGAELDRRERRRAADARSTYRDDPDGADV